MRRLGGMTIHHALEETLACDAIPFAVSSAARNRLGPWSGNCAPTETTPAVPRARIRARSARQALATNGRRVIFLTLRVLWRRSGTRTPSRRHRGPLPVPAPGARSDAAGVLTVAARRTSAVAPQDRRGGNPPRRRPETRGVVTTNPVCDTSTSIDEGSRRYRRRTPGAAAIDVDHVHGERRRLSLRGAPLANGSRSVSPPPPRRTGRTVGRRPLHNVAPAAA